MKTKQLLFLALLLFALSAKAAVIIPGGGGGGVTVIAGSTNGIAMLDGFGTNTTIKTRLTVDGELLSTNGAIEVGQASFPITFGSQGNGWLMTNWYALYQNGGMTFNQSGVSLNFDNGSILQVGNASAASARIFGGSILQLDDGAHFLMGSLTANRVMVVGANDYVTNHPDMRLAASLSGAADGEVLKYHGASGTWTNGTDTGSASISTNGNQFGASVPITIKDGALLTNAVVYNELGQSIRLHGVNIVSVGANELRFGVNGSTNWALNSSGNLVPTAGLTYDIGGFGNMVRNITANTITNMTLAKPSIAPPGAGGLVHLNGTNQNWFVSATTNVLLVLTNLKAGVDYVAAVSNGANVSVTMSNAAAIKVPSGSFPSFNTNGFTYLTFRIDDISASTNLMAFASSELSLVAGWKLGMGTNASAQTVTLNVTNAQTLIASNATSVQVDFSAGTPDYYSTDVMRANLSVQPTNLVVGRTATVYLTGDTNANERTVTVITNGIAGGAAIRWFFNTPTNGATSFTVTNTQRAELSLKVLSATEIWAAWSPVR